MSSPTKREWAELHAAFQDFCQAQPWRLMGEDLVAVEDPSGGDVGYCAVMGSGGMEYGITIWAGDERLASLANLMAEDVETEADAAFHLLRSISAMLVDRADLRKDDLSVIRSLDLRYRGKGAWPLFRSATPGYLPWFLDALEARFLAMVLRQTTAVASRVLREALVLWNEADPELILTRYYRDGAWKEEWRRPNPPQPPADVPDFPDQRRLQQLVQSSTERFRSWELSRFWFPASVQEKRDERPYLPTAIMAVERTVGLVVGNELLGSHPTIEEQQRAVVAILEESPLIPEEIVVDREDTARIVEPITRPMGIKLSVDRLPMLE